MKSVLIACSRLVDLAGAEVCTLELAEALHRLGWAVTLASFEIGGAVGQEVKEMGLPHFNLSDAACFSMRQRFDLAWIHHTVTANRLLADEKISLGCVVFSSLSHFNAMECPPDSRFRLSRYLVHSEENRKHFVSNYPELSSSLRVMNNSVLERYWESTRDEKFCLENLSGKIGLHRSAEGLSRIAIVSNHLPRESVELIDLLRARGVEVDVFGVSAQSSRVTPDTLRSYDAILTIGKTVQYAIAAKTPVYCYDHFGGDGWVTSENFEIGRAFNFSGRGGRGRVPAEQLKREIIDGYPAARKEAETLYELGRKVFVLERNIETVLQEIRDYSPPALTRTDSNILIRECGVFVDSRALISYRDNFIFDLHRQVEEEQANARRQIEYRDAVAVELRKQIQEEQANARQQIEYREALVAELRKQLGEEQSNARQQIEYREALVAELRKQLGEEQSNARQQIEYREALVAELRKQLGAEQSNARQQIEYREALVAELRKQLGEEQSNARQQIEYRDALAAELHGKLGEEQLNARQQIEYRDELAFELRQQLDEQRVNARQQIEFRDAMVVELREQLEFVKTNMRQEIESRDVVIGAIRQRPIKFAATQIFSTVLRFFNGTELNK